MNELTCYSHMSRAGLLWCPGGLERALERALEIWGASTSTARHGSRHGLGMTNQS